MHHQKFDLFILLLLIHNSYKDTYNYEITISMETSVQEKTPYRGYVIFLELVGLIMLLVVIVIVILKIRQRKGEVEWGAFIKWTKPAILRGVMIKRNGEWSERTKQKKR